MEQLILAILIIIYGSLYYISIAAQFATLATFTIQAFFGNYFLSLIGLMISGFAGIGIIRNVVKIRTTAFKEQNLGQSTTLKLSKIIVAIKTYAYYTLLCFFPKRLGLYHTYEYHYSEKTEKEDRMFWLGFLFLIITGLLWYYGDYIIRFAILWYIAYLFIFLNWITIHQFVSERYCYIPVIGICILSAYALQNFPILFALIVGLLLMRTWMHLPTYNDEVMFYQSNIWNHPNSEVAFTNLGVVYMRLNLIGSAIDMWEISTRINPDYDVGYYNVHSTLKGKGDLIHARENLIKALNSKQCHFKEAWTKELGELDHEIQYVNEINILSKQLAELEKDPNKKENVNALRKQLDELQQIHKKIEEQKKTQLVILQKEQDELKYRIVGLDKKKEELSKSISTDELVKIRDKNFILIKEGAYKLLEVKNENPASGIQKV